MTRSATIQFQVAIPDDASAQSSKELGEILVNQLQAYGVVALASRIEVLSSDDTPSAAEARRRFENATALAMIAEQMEENFQKWGEQNYLDGTSRALKFSADAARRRTDSTNKADMTWQIVLDEEVKEAYSEVDPLALVAELKDVGAVTGQWLAHHVRRMA